MASVYEIVRAPSSGVQFPEKSFWDGARVGKVEWVHPKTGSDHTPAVEFRLMWDESALYLRFDVKDRWVRCIQTEPQSMVYLDSCVEFFMQPAQNGYLNLECSANGTFLCYHITDNERRPGGFAAFRPLTLEELKAIEVVSSLKGVIDPEITEVVEWWLAARIPMKLLAIADGKVPRVGSNWRGNFFKCGEGTSHPHAMTWSPIGEVLDFHKPEHFGNLLFI